MVSQELQLLYARARDLSDARRRLHRILDRCARAEVPELIRLGRTLDAWHEELLAYWTPTGRRGVSNGPTEAVNALFKRVKRVGHGFRNLHNYRLRLLLAVGLDWKTVPWQVPPAPRSEAAHHAWWRRARLVRAEGRHVRQQARWPESDGSGARPSR